MEAAYKEALKGMRNNEGGPFGAVVVRDDKIVARAHNQVIVKHDPTAHAEMQAIRKASRKLKRFDLSDCDIYTVGEPCPMCFAAIHWAHIRKVYFGCTEKEAGSIGFDDDYLYRILKGEEKDSISEIEVDHGTCIKAFREWKNKKDKTPY